MSRNNQTPRPNVLDDEGLPYKSTPDFVKIKSNLEKVYPLQLSLVSFTHHPEEQSIFEIVFQEYDDL